MEADSIKDSPRYKGKREPIGRTKFLSAVWMKGQITEAQKEAILEVCVTLKTKLITVNGEKSMSGSIEINPSERKACDAAFRKAGVQIVVLGRTTS